MRTILGLAVALALVPVSVRGEVARVEIRSRTDVAGAKSFGDVGPYEELAGTVFFTIDPTHPLNRVIVDLDKAPRNSQGRVEFSSDLKILVPKDRSRANGVLLFDIVNRGNSMLGFFTGAGEALGASPEIGDGFLMRQGFTLVAVGWEVGLPPGAIGVHAPVASNGSDPIVGPISNWFVPAEESRTFNLLTGNFTGFQIYPPLDLRQPDARLTERVGLGGEEKLIPRAEWVFGKLVDGKTVEDPFSIVMTRPFKPGNTYEVTYRTKNPLVDGVGFAAIRDLASALKYDRSAVVSGRYAYAFGASQTGRYLRALMHGGFTTDEHDRPVFDAVWVHIAGGATGSFNERFAQPKAGSHLTAVGFPMLYAVERDPVSGRSDGLSVRMPARGQPRVFFSNSSTEYWGAGRLAALTHVTMDGQRDVSQPDNVRMYFIAGTQHGGGTFPPQSTAGQLKSNPLDYRWALRALFVALDNWVRRAEVPPASRYPTLANRTLIAQREIKFPPVPGVQWPTGIAGGYRADLSKPVTNHPLPFLVPNVDSDGNETGGIRLPEHAVPLGTYSGWVFRARIGAPNEILPLVGSFIPLPLTKADREKRGDPRLSVAERYAGREAYVRAVEDAGRELVKQRYVLAEDLPSIVRQAGGHWDWITTPANGSR